jgi:hypothetical protein
VTIFSDRYRLVLKDGRWLGFVRTHNSRSDPQCPNHGALEAWHICRRDSSRRSRQPVSSEFYQRLLTKHGLTCSMSGTGNCYDNGCPESFFHFLKVEATHGERFEKRRQMRRVELAYFETFYNRIRRHSTNERISTVISYTKKSLLSQ